MTEHVFSLVSAINARMDRLRSRGCELAVTHDFEDAARRLEAVGKPYLTPSLSFAWNDFTRDSCFWVSLALEGDVMGAAGVKREVLNGEPISSYWRRSLKRQYPRDDGADVISSVSPLVDLSLGGELAYFGDLYFHPKLRELRVLEDFGRVVLYHAALSFRVQTFYAFLKDRDLRRGFGFQLGLMSCIPQAQVWSQPFPEGRGSHEACCFSRRDQVLELARLDAGIA